MGRQETEEQEPIEAAGLDDSITEARTTHGDDAPYTYVCDVCGDEILVRDPPVTIDHPPYEHDSDDRGAFIRKQEE